MRKLRDASSDLGFAAASRTDHQNILGDDFRLWMTNKTAQERSAGLPAGAPRPPLEIFGQQVAPPAIPEGDRHRALRLFLPDDVLVQLFNNLRAPRRSMIARALRGQRRRALAARTSRGFSATPAPDVVISSSTEGTSTSRGSPPSLAEPTGLENSRGGDCEAHVRPAWRPAYHVVCCRARRSMVSSDEGPELRPQAARTSAERRFQTMVRMESAARALQRRR